MSPTARVPAVVAALVLASGCSAARAERWTAVPADSFSVPGRTVRISGLLGGDGVRPWLAVGSQADSHGVLAPMGWSSHDGSAWSRDPIRPVSLDGPLDRLIGLARQGGVAVSAGQYQSANEGNIRPGMWHRDADGAWHEVRAPRELFGGPRGGGLVTVAASPAGFVLVGGWTGLDDHFDIGVWNSPDGTTWTHLDGNPALSAQGNESIRAVAASGGPAGLVIVGEVDLGAVRLGALWWSADGYKWSRTDVAGSATLEQVVATPSGFVAVGLRSDGTPAAWRSADGQSWRPAGRLPGGGLPFGVTLTGTAVAGGDVIVGGVSAGRVRLWRSAGGGWRSLGLGGGLGSIGEVTDVIVGTRSPTVVVAVNVQQRPLFWRLA